jgi:CheY-like chemotaxis protein
VTHGSTFWVTLPAMSGIGAHDRPAAASAEPVTLTGVGILIVDDDTDARELLVAMMEEYGARVLAVDSADAALRILDGDGNGFSPDVLVSDIGMPGTDGFALARNLRNLPSEKMRRLPAIAVTAYANPEDRVRALVAGYQHHVPKPVDADQLAAAIAQLLAR